MSEQVPLSVQQSLPSEDANHGFGDNVQAQSSQNPQGGNRQFQLFSPDTPQEHTHGQTNSSYPQPLDSTSNSNPLFTPPASSEINDTLMQMEQDSAQLRLLDAQLDQIVSEAPQTFRPEIDDRSIYIGNVDYGSTPMELQQHFSDCGVVERVTIMTNKLTGHPKGFAYLEFSTAEAANMAVDTMNDSMFRDRELKVSIKRTNIPAAGRGGRGRGRGRGMMRGRGRGMFRGRGGFRGGNRFLPY